MQLIQEVPCEVVAFFCISNFGYQCDDRVTLSCASYCSLEYRQDAAAVGWGLAGALAAVLAVSLLQRLVGATTQSAITGMLCHTADNFHACVLSWVWIAGSSARVGIAGSTARLGI